MKRAILVWVALVAMAGAARSQNEKFSGSWLLTKAVVDDKVSAPYQIMEYRDDGKMLMMGIEFGTWKYDKNDNAIVMKSQLDKDFNQTVKVIEIDNGKLITQNENGKYFYTRIDPGAIADDNKNSGLEGVWKLQSDDGADKFLKFELPDNYTYMEVAPESTETSNGTWIYNQKEKTVIIIGFTQMLRGKCDIEKLTDDELVFRNKGELLKAVKEKTDNVAVEKLDFDYDEIEKEDEERQNEGVNELPWMDFDQMVDYLGHVEYLKFRRGNLVNEVGKISYTHSIISKIRVVDDKPAVEFTNLDVSQGDTMQFSQNYKGGLMERYNDFFPKEEPFPYRVAGKNITVDVPAGTFTCTVIEGFDGDDKVKYWMINDKPGVYAKIVTIGDMFGELRYVVTELTEIRQK